MAYCRLEDTFRTDAKFTKLARTLEIERAHARGLAAGLWSWAVTNAPDGFLGRIDAEDLAEAAEWSGDPDALMESMVSIGLIDRVEGGFEIHAYYKRAESYRRATQRRDSRNRKNGDAPGPPTSVSLSDAGLADPPTKVAPVQLGKGAKKAPTPDILRVFQAWTDRYPDEYLMPHGTLKEWRAINDRIVRDGLTADQMIEAIAGIHRDPWPDRGRNLTLWNAIKDQEAVHRFRKMAQPERSRRYGQTPTPDVEEPALTEEEAADQHGKSLDAVRKLVKEL